jgi:adenylylsulfate kinase
MSDPSSAPVYAYAQSGHRSVSKPLMAQHAKAFWFTGLSASGKTTIASHIATLLLEQKFIVKILDGDNLREGINSDLGFSEKDRFENIRRAAEVSKMFVQTGIITLNCFITPTNELRNLARSIIGPGDYFEIFVKASADICGRRDPKGLYQKARSGHLSHFPGVNAPFEIPCAADFTVDTSETDVVASVGQVMNFLLPIVKAGSAFLR